MKSLFLFTILLICGTPLFSQIASFKKYEGRTLYVVLEKDSTSEMSRTLRRAMNSCWTLSKFEFITPAEFNAKHKERNTEAPFLAIEDFTFGNLSSDTAMDCRALHFFYYVQDSLRTRPETFVTIPEGFEYSKTIYRIDGTRKTPIAAHGHGLNYYETIFLLRYYQSGVKPVHDFKIDANGSTKASMALMRSKTLCLTGAMIDQDLTLKAIQSAYHFPVMIVSQDQINRAIEEKNPTIIYGIQGAMKMTVPGMEQTGISNLFLVDAESGEIVFYILANTPYLTKGNFKIFGKE